MPLTAVATRSRSETAVRSLENARETEEAATFMILGCYVEPRKLFLEVATKRHIRHKRLNVFHFVLFVPFCGYQDNVARPAGAAMESKLNSRLGSCNPRSSACKGPRSPPVVS